MSKMSDMAMIIEDLRNAATAINDEIGRASCRERV